MTCKICGADMPDDATFCPQCGCNNKINSATATNHTSFFTPYTQIQKQNKPGQIIRLIIEVVICAIIAFFGIVTAVLGTVKSCGILVIIMSGALLWLLIKNPKIPKKEANTNNYKLQGASRWILIITCVIAAFILILKGFVG